MKVVVHPWIYLAAGALVRHRPWVKLSAEQCYVRPCDILTSMLRYAVRMPLPIGSERALKQAVLLREDRSPPRRLGGPAARNVAMIEVVRVLAATELCVEHHDYPGENTEVFREFLDTYAQMCLALAPGGFMADALEYALRPE